MIDYVVGSGWDLHYILFHGVVCSCVVSVAVASVNLIVVQH